jgi:hypothetical protein
LSGKILIAPVDYDLTVFFGVFPRINMEPPTVPSISKYKMVVLGRPLLDMMLILELLQLITPEQVGK